MNQGKLPLVLRQREPALDGDAMDGTYDSCRDIWVDAYGAPLAETPRPRPTILTKTREGIDQLEHHQRLSMTRFGETLQTNTREGIDQAEHAEGVISASWGRTMITRTREGIDTSEGQGLA